MKIIYALLLLCVNVMAVAMQCPDPQTSSLRYGEVPEPWQVSPFSPQNPQGEAGASFVKATILAYGALGKGVVCTYKISTGNYEIWIQAPTKIPASTDNHWIEINSGYICSEGLSACEFYISQV